MLTTYLLIFITISFSRAFLFNPSVNDSSYGYKCPQHHSLTMQAINQMPVFSTKCSVCVLGNIDNETMGSIY